MKKMKNLLAVILSVALVMALCTCGVSAADETAGESTEVSEETLGAETTTSDTATAEVPEEPEIIHIADGEELPDYFYVVPKEKIQAKGEFSLEGLYAYIAISLKHDYCDPKGITLPLPEGRSLQYSDVDLGIIQRYYKRAINKYDEFSYSLKDTYHKYDINDFHENAELVECLMRAIFVYGEAVGYERDYLEEALFYESFELTPEKITFSDEQLHYFDD